MYKLGWDEMEHMNLCIEIKKKRIWGEKNLNLKCD